MAGKKIFLKKKKPSKQDLEGFDSFMLMNL